eukprot:5755865-Alexandrium_andersonii.AAC.1
MPVDDCVSPRPRQARTWGLSPCAASSRPARRRWPCWSTWRSPRCGSRPPAGGWVRRRSWRSAPRRSRRG